mmetsp:Transcript_15510/g.24103  ORF Transcript_15510/g.24103 Transcript_15510/m.24103 type:complete len:185 (+) Transcript_15510:163-717(+)
MMASRKADERYKQAADSIYEPFLLLLVGIPGSGKSTFAKALEKGKPGRYVRVNQDELGSRMTCEDLCRRTLVHDKKTAVIDRCNFDKNQRRYFLEIARQLGVSAECILFDFDEEECIARCRDRQDHETLAPNMAGEVVRRMKNLLDVDSVMDVKHEFRFRRVCCIDDLQMFDDILCEYLGHLYA